MSDELDDLRAPPDTQPVTYSHTERDAPKVDGAPEGQEPVYTEFKTHDECLEHIARTTWSYNFGFISERQARINLQAAEKAAKILGERQGQSSKAAQILRSLARSQPAEDARGQDELPTFKAQADFDQLVEEHEEE